VPRQRSCLAPWILLIPSLALPSTGHSQGLPELSPINPVAASRSGLYFQPFRNPAPGRWTSAISLDYASIIEYNRLPQADYVLDAEILRFSVGLARDLSSRTFVSLNTALGGSYAGFLDGFLNWYHGVLGIDVQERKRRPSDSFFYSITLPDGSGLQRTSSNLFLEDVRVGLGLRYTRGLQSLLSLTLPTATGPGGYGKGVVSVGLLNTFRVPLHPRVIYEGSVGVGYTPTHGGLRSSQREVFAATSSGLRIRFLSRQSLFANLFYHSPYYHNTTLPALDRRELSLDFGWILRHSRGGEFRVGMTEDLEPGGPAVDLVFRFGGSF
jgi:hypothetical protein